MIGRCLELARAVGAANISITTGRLLGGVPPVRADQLLKEGLLRALEMADRAQIDIGIECEPGLYLEYASELREWIDRLGHPRLGANLDVGHSQVLGEDIPQSIKLLKGRTWNLHVEDIPRPEALSHDSRRGNDGLGDSSRCVARDWVRADGDSRTVHAYGRSGCGST